MAEAAGSSDRISLSRYYNASQFRIDTWNELKIVTQRLADGRGRDEDTEIARKHLDSLAPTEMYWAFPGEHAFQQLHRLLHAADYSNLARTVSRCVGGLMSGLYRRRHISLGVSSKLDDAEAEDLADGEDDRTRRRCYF